MFEASSYPDFRDAVTVHTITKADSHTHDITIPETTDSYRYWRYRPRAIDSFCNIAEIAFLDRSGSKMHGTVIGTDGTNPGNPSATKEKAFDGNVLTYFDASTSTGAWVGVDFGRPVDVATIRYTPRGDGNNIEPDDTYELLYMTTDGWQSIGMQTATGINLTFDGVPSNALLLLIDRTKGREHRIFAMQNHSQRFL